MGGLSGIGGLGGLGELNFFSGLGVLCGVGDLGGLGCLGVAGGLGGLGVLCGLGDLCGLCCLGVAGGLGGLGAEMQKTGDAVCANFLHQCYTFGFACNCSVFLHVFAHFCMFSRIFCANFT